MRLLLNYLPAVSALTVALVCACGPERSDSVTDTASTDATSTTDTPTTGTTDPSGTTSTTDPSGTTSTTDPSGTTGVPACGPGPINGDLECVPQGETQAYWLFAEGEFVSDAFDEVCTIDSVTDDGTTQGIKMTCPSDPRNLQLTTSSPHVALDLAMGATVRLQYTPEIDGEVITGSFALRAEDDTLLAAGLDRWISFPIAFDPLNIDLRSTNCNGTGDDCSVIQRAGFEVEDGGQSVVVFGGNAGALGDLQILVNDSSRGICFGDGPACGFNYSPYSTSALLLRAP